MTNPLPKVPLEIANLARGEAVRMRAAALLGIAEGFLTIWDVIGDAAADEHRTLLKIRVRQLLLAQDGWGPFLTRTVMEKMFATLDVPVPDHDQLIALNVAWLLDSRTGGNRLAALADVIACREETGPPWPGFPYSPMPAEHPLSPRGGDRA